MGSVGVSFRVSYTIRSKKREVGQFWNKGDAGSVGSSSAAGFPVAGLEDVAVGLPTSTVVASVKGMYERQV